LSRIPYGETFISNKDCILNKKSNNGVTEMKSKIGILITVSVTVALALSGLAGAVDIEGGSTNYARGSGQSYGGTYYDSVNGLYMEAVATVNGPGYTLSQFSDAQQYLDEENDANLEIDGYVTAYASSTQENGVIMASAAMGAHSNGWAGFDARVEGENGIGGAFVEGYAMMNKLNEDRYSFTSGSSSACGPGSRAFMATAALEGGPQIIDLEQGTAFNEPFLLHVNVDGEAIHVDWTNIESLPSI
jgi:hypothetical protein